MIKSLVSPQEVVFGFPFQLEVDWAFQRRSAVKSELHVRTDPVPFSRFADGSLMTVGKCGA